MVTVFLSGCEATGPVPLAHEGGRGVQPVSWEIRKSPAL